MSENNPPIPSSKLQSTGEILVLLQKKPIGKRWREGIRFYVPIVDQNTDGTEGNEVVGIAFRPTTHF